MILIPRRRALRISQDFIPISIMHSIAKILAKVVWHLN
jgi:hypothetical protein